MKSQSLAASAGGEVGVSLKPGGYAGGMCLVEWKSGRAPACPWYS